MQVVLRLGVIHGLLSNGDIKDPVEVWSHPRSNNKEAYASVWPHVPKQLQDKAVNEERISRVGGRVHSSSAPTSSSRCKYSFRNCIYSSSVTSPLATSGTSSCASSLTYSSAVFTKSGPPGPLDISSNRWAVFTRASTGPLFRVLTSLGMATSSVISFKYSSIAFRTRGSSYLERILSRTHPMNSNGCSASHFWMRSFPTI